MLHNVVGNANGIADRCAVVRERQAWQRFLPQGADYRRRHIGAGANHDVNVPVPVAPFVDGEILEPQPETTEPIAKPPQKPLESLGEFLIRNHAKHRHAKLLGRGKVLKAPAQTHRHLHGPTSATFEGATRAPTRYPNRLARPGGRRDTRVPAVKRGANGFASYV
jgi:hypothetical protein